MFVCVEGVGGGEEVYDYLENSVAIFPGVFGEKDTL